MVSSIKWSIIFGLKLVLVKRNIKNLLVGKYIRSHQQFTAKQNFSVRLSETFVQKNKTQGNLNQTLLFSLKRERKKIKRKSKNDSLSC